SELVAGALERGAQLVVVLDDAVVDDREPVARDVRVRVALARRAVRRPAGMRDAELAFERMLRECLVEHLHLADRAHPLELLLRVEHREARRVIAAVFEPPQALDQDGYDIALGDGSDDSTHEAAGSPV